MKNKLTILSVVLVFVACFATLAQREPNVREARPNEVPFVFNAGDYGKIEIESVEKAVVQEGDLPTEAPAHSCYRLEDKRPLPALDQGARYFYPAFSSICIVPLTDASVANYAKSYPYIHEAATKLRRLLARHPPKLNFNKDLNDVPFNEASGSVQSKVQYLDFKTGKGVLFLTQYSQDVVATPLNNEELTCDFQGISNDGKYYVAARLAITHPSLPKGIDSTKPPPQNVNVAVYRSKQERLLNSFTDESFKPSLKSLKSMIASITTN
jgi:hypothetical protein